jgi:secreted trypsin-like serine protease
MFQKVFDDREVRNILVGVVSFGVSCGAGRGIYTDVSSYMDWILETIQK